MSDWDTGTQELLARLDSGVLSITLNRPDKRNALSDHLTPALRETLRLADTDPRVRCVLISGAGEAFCAGGDVSGMASNNAASSEPAGPPPSPDDRVRELRDKQRNLTLRLHELSKPTIAALPGPAAGAGLSIALACDIRIAAERAFMTTAFANIGMSGDYGCSWFMTHLIGPALTRELFFTSRRVGATEAKQLGLVNEVVANESLLDHSMNLAQQIAAGPPVALRYMKENLNRALTADLATCLDMEADRMVRSARTDDHRAAVKAFMSKSKPVFTGR